MPGVHFLRPELLWLFLLLPPVLWFWQKRRGNQGDWQQVIDAHLLSHLQITHRQRRGLSNPFYLGAILALLILAAAGPSTQKIELPVFQKADALVIVLDLSASMLANDVQPSRVKRARQKILDLLALRSEGVTALVAFAGDAHVVTPLTDDVDTIANLLPALDPTMMPVPGAKPLAALELATQLLQSAKLNNGHVLILTDELPNLGIENAQALLSAANASLSILGIGTPAGAPIPLTNGGFLRDKNNDIVIPTFDAGELASIARALGGQFRSVTLDNSDLLDVMASNPVTDTTLAVERQSDTWYDQGHWLAAIAALLLLPLFRSGTTLLVLLIPLVLPETASAASWEDLWQTKDQQAYKALKEGDLERAAQSFEDPRWRGVAQYDAADYEAAASVFSSLPEDANALYNAGNALVQMGQYEEAIKRYEASLERQPNQADAQKNLEIAKALLAQQQQQQSENESSGAGGNDEQSSDDTENTEGENNESSGTQQSTDKPENSEQPPGDPNSQGSTGNTEDAAPQNQAAEAGTGGGDPTEQELEQQTQQQMEKFNEALEKQQQLEQWLRKVPDDPSGLLRRKFRYESLQRLREGEELNDDVQW